MVRSRPPEVVFVRSVTRKALGSKLYHQPMPQMPKTLVAYSVSQAGLMSVRPAAPGVGRVLHIECTLGSTDFYIDQDGGNGGNGGGNLPKTGPKRVIRAGASRNTHPNYTLQVVFSTDIVLDTLRIAPGDELHIVDESMELVPA